ncbi:ADAM 17-like protease, partial [Argonauta hians]
SGNIHEKLFYFETLKVQDIHVITRRNVDNDPRSQLTLVTFHGLGRQFNFYLHSTQRLLTRDFSASTVDGNEHKTPVFINKHAFYEGALQDDKESHVDAVWEGDDLLATITTSNDTYTVEPSWRHLPDSSNHSMIIYKGSDVKTLYISTDHSSLHPFCDYQPSVIPPEVEFENHQRNNIYKEPLYNQSIHSNETWSQSNCKHDRRRRDVLPKDNCEVMLIADYIYFQNIGNSSVLKTINYMMQVMTRVDSIFRSTVWDEDEDGELKGFGVKVKEELKGNSEDNNFCLVHLFTYQGFKGGVVGIAFIKNISEPSGGICSASDPYPGANAGLSSSLSMHGYQLLFPQALLVTTHGS